MLRLIHSQTQQGPLLVDDIDDGLPNKTAYRQGSVADPNAYARDGYANKPKQPCYIPRVKPTDTTLPGYIDLEETSRVLHSSGGGKILGLQGAGLLRVVSFVESDLAAPTITATTSDIPAPGDLTITGTNFLSVDPEITTVIFSGAGIGSVTLTKAQIEAVAPGSVSNTSIVIDSILLPGLIDGDTVRVRSDAQTTASFTIFTSPVITAATLDLPAVGDITIDGADFDSVLPNVTSVTFDGPGVGVPITLTAAQIIAVPPGAVGAAQIIVDSTLVPGLADGDTIVVTADGKASVAWTIISTPVITGLTLNDPASGDITIDGVYFDSFAPNETTVTFDGPGVGAPITLTAAQIIAVAPGAVSATQIIVDSTLVPGLAPDDTVVVTADGVASAAATVPASITAATLDAPALGDVTVDGVGFLVFGSIHLVGAGVGNVTLDGPTILGVAPGAISDVQVVVDSTLVPGLAPGDTVTINADGQDSNTFTIV